MKWFKHVSGSLKDSVIFEAIEIYGPAAYLIFFGTLELVADEFDSQNPGVARLSIKKMTRFFQLSRQKTVRILKHFDQIANNNPKKNVSFFVTFEKDHVIINCPKLAELSDNHTSKIIRGTSKLLRSENEVTSSQEAEADVDTKATKEVQQPHLKNFPTTIPVGGFSKDEIFESSPSKTDIDIVSIANELSSSGKFHKVHDFVQTEKSLKMHPKAILHALNRLYLLDPKGKVLNPVSYCKRIVLVESGNYYEREAVANHR